MDSAYDSLSSELSDACTDGQFTSYLNSYGESLGVVALMNASVSTVWTGDASVVIFGDDGMPTYQPTVLPGLGSAFGLSTGAVVGIIFGVLACVCCSCFFAYRKMFGKEDVSEQWNQHYDSQKARTTGRRNQKMDDDDAPRISASNIYDYDDDEDDVEKSSPQRRDSQSNEGSQKRQVLNNSKSRIAALMKDKSVGSAKQKAAAAAAAAEDAKDNEGALGSVRQV